MTDVTAVRRSSFPATAPDDQGRSGSHGVVGRRWAAPTARNRSAWRATDRMVETRDGQ